MEMNMVDAASGGALVNMTPQQARDLISTVAANSQQFRANPEPPRRKKQRQPGVIIQLADRSIVHLEGVLEDVLIKVNELIFPADFYVIKMEEDNTTGSSDLLLGRPLLSTTSTKIDVRSGTFTMKFDGEIVKFNVYNAISHPSEILSASELELKPLLEHLKYAFLGTGNTLPIIISNKLSKPEEESLIQKDKKFEFSPQCKEGFYTLKQKLVTAPVVQAPDWNYPFEIMCDASEQSVEAVLGQKISKEPHVIYYASKTLDAAQTFRYLIAKKDAKPRLIRWILLLQEFDIEICDKKGCENLVADHLGRIKTPFDDVPIKDEFPDESLLLTEAHYPWYADIVNLLTTNSLPTELARSVKDKLRREA
ncbi:uncharacterized protein [Gossypium hirsutum]|uniref:Reverse transcriptase/retrotransposon-derived protein RNase H-like domain-containing protein n=1 Tax=Gossypium hirsutum TaxID=3635 RepID=A0ABM2ZAD8_GOSHI|nr:uncharacterized protein LOC121211199 [Gossypium hirsutum]